MSIEDCIDSFQSLCQKAFTRRTGSNLPLLGWLVDNYNHSKYETKPIEDALQETFDKKQLLFGGEQLTIPPGCPVKVAVTSTSAGGGRPVVFSNYNRPCFKKRETDLPNPNVSESF